MRTALFVLAFLVVASAGTASPVATLPTGKFRTVISDADLRRGKANLTELSVNHGTYTLTLTPGRFSFFHPESFEARLVRGVVQIKGNTANFVVKTPFSFQGISFLAKWRVQAGKLYFTVIWAELPELRVVFGAHPWRKIG